MNASLRIALSSAILSTAVAGAAQNLPAEQPELLLIQIESIKLGQDGAHSQTEAGWPAAYDRASSPYSYLALATMTGRSEVWFVNPYASYAAMADSFRKEDEDPTLAAELARLYRADAEHLTDFQSIHAAARKDLSHGAFPDTTKQRFWEITTFHIRPGGAGAFEAAAKTYGTVAGRVAPNSSFRVYEVVAGAAGATYLSFSSVVSIADFDKTTA